MRRALFVCAALAAMIGMSGCACTGGLRGSCARAPENCARSCGLLGRLGCRGIGRGGTGSEMIQAGPPTGAIAYPYYTTRGPRDFLANNPPSIGP
ncbi:MAG: hypothetical protein RBS80_03905 [Thermoguttaceae bacterium]|nr:hypothetical protein [Thermoguttaceae bacterium]